MRLLVVSVLGCSLHLPPLATAVQQALILPFVGTACDYCSAPLLTDPLTQHRLAALWGLLHAGTASLASPLATLADPRVPGERALFRGSTLSTLAGPMAAAEKHVCNGCFSA